MAGEIKHEWNGTVLIITSDSGTSSMDLKGDKGDKGCRGAQGRAGVILNSDGTVDMSGYATEVYVDEQIVKVNTGGSIDLKNYATVAYVEEKFADIGESMDFTNYYDKTETDTIVSNTMNQHLNSAQHITTNGVNTLIDNALEDSGFQTASQVKALIDEALDAFGTAEGGSY